MVSVVKYQTLQDLKFGLLAHFDDIEVSDISLECDETSIRIFFGDEFSYEIIVEDKGSLVALFKQLSLSVVEFKVVNLFQLLDTCLLKGIKSVKAIQGDKSSDLTPFVSKN